MRWSDFSCRGKQLHPHVASALLVFISCFKFSYTLKDGCSGVIRIHKFWCFLEGILPFIHLIHQSSSLQGKKNEFKYVLWDGGGGRPTRQSLCFTQVNLHLHSSGLCKGGKNKGLHIQTVELSQARSSVEVMDFASWPGVFCT